MPANIPSVAVFSHRLNIDVEKTDSPCAASSWTTSPTCAWQANKRLCASWDCYLEVHAYILANMQVRTTMTILHTDTNSITRDSQTCSTHSWLDVQKLIERQASTIWKSSSTARSPPCYSCWSICSSNECLWTRRPHTTLSHTRTHTHALTSVPQKSNFAPILWCCSVGRNALSVQFLHQWQGPQSKTQGAYSPPTSLTYFFALGR